MGILQILGGNPPCAIRCFSLTTSFDDSRSLNEKESDKFSSTVVSRRANIVRFGRGCYSSVALAIQYKLKNNDVGC